MRDRNLNKRAEIGETITWVFATIIIITILLISIFISSKFFKKGNYENLPQLRTSDIFVTKSLTSYLLTKDSSGEMIFNQINKDSDLNGFNGLLSNQIFLNLYKANYPGGIILDVRGAGARFFGGSIRSNYYTESTLLGSDIEERIYFGDTPDISTKKLVLFLRR